MDMTLLRRFGMVVALTLLLTACNGGDGGQSTPSASSTPAATQTAAPTVVPTATPSVEEEVSQAYLHYWEVYSEALYNLDTSRLSEVMTGPRLERALEEVQGLQDQGRAVKIVVDNRPVVVQAGSDQAVVLDSYENRSYFIDPVTKEPLSQPPETAETIRDRVTLTRVGGTWKVLDTVREVSQQ
jgi:hypothetical protein